MDKGHIVNPDKCHDLTFIHAEGMNLGGDFQEKGLNQAKARLSEIS